MNEQKDEATEADDQPWGQPGGVRRDCLPHRGDFLLRWARGGVFCSFVSTCFFPAAVLGIAICLVVAVVAWNDLAEIRKEARDKSGEVETNRAFDTALVGFVIAIPVGSLGVVVFMCAWGVYDFLSSGAMG